MTPHKLTPEEQELADKYRKAEKIAFDLDDQLYELFMKSVRPLLDAGDFTAAREYIILMPDGVGRMYIADAIRVARGDFNDNK